MTKSSTLSSNFFSSQIGYSSIMSVPTVPTTIYHASFPPSSDHSSPNSVIPTVPPCEIIQNRDRIRTFDGFQLEQNRPTKMPKPDEAAWVCPVSSKGLRRCSSDIKDRVQPILERIQMGCQRVDGKNPISLAVSTTCPTRSFGEAKIPSQVDMQRRKALIL
jgi:hypothetical protein